MLLACTNKGCYKTDAHTLDPETNKVHCLDCGLEIATTKQMINTLRSVNQTKKKIRSGIQSVCQACKKQDNPILKKSGGQTYTAHCRSCGIKLDINGSSIEAMKQIGGYLETDSDEDRNLVSMDAKKNVI